jgi:SagB-type dehydrogenase family enzyme
MFQSNPLSSVLLAPSIMAAPDAAKALYGDAADSSLPRSPGGGPALLALPPPTITSSGAPLARVLASRRSERDFDKAAPLLALGDVSQLLWAAQGVTAPPSSADANAPSGRTVPSAGALFPLEAFLVVGDNTVQARASTMRMRARQRKTGDRTGDGACVSGDVQECAHVEGLADVTAPCVLRASTKLAQGLQPGVWWYRSGAHDVQRIRTFSNGAASLASDAACAQPWLAAAPAVLVIAAAPQRTVARYGAERGERYVLMEAGCAAQNVLLQSEALGLGAAWVGAFHDDGVRDALGLPPGLRPLAVLPVGRRAPPGAPHAGAEEHAAAMRDAATAAGGGGGGVGSPAEQGGAQQRRVVAVRDTEHDID